MRLYELVLVLKPTLADKERTAVFKTVKGWLKDVKVAKEDEWGQKPLAYKVKKELAGHFTRWFLETETSIPTDVESKLLQEVNIIRHLLVRTK